MSEVEKASMVRIAYKSSDGSNNINFSLPTQTPFGSIFASHQTVSPRHHAEVQIHRQGRSHRSRRQTRDESPEAALGILAYKAAQ